MEMIIFYEFIHLDQFMRLIVPASPPSTGFDHKGSISCLLQNNEAYG
jgi:hypothetical protein